MEVSYYYCFQSILILVILVQSTVSGRLLDIAPHNESHRPHCSQSWHDTDGYFCQSNEHWVQRKEVTLRAYDRNSKRKTYPGNGRTFFQENWHPELRHANSPGFICFNNSMHCDVMLFFSNAALPLLTTNKNLQMSKCPAAAHSTVVVCC